ncbi:ATP-binding protein [Nakamurella sp. GG22]
MTARELPLGAAVNVLSVPAEPLELRKLTDWVATLLEVEDALADLRPKVELAVHEVCMNVIDHAYGAAHPTGPADITIAGSVDHDAVRVRVTDTGAPFDPAAVRPPVQGVPQIRGYGLVIAQKLTDELTYDRADGANVWSLRFDRPRFDRPSFDRPSFDRPTDVQENRS